MHSKSSAGVSPDPMGCFVFHRPELVGYRDNRILRRQMEDRGRVQRTKAGYRQCRNPDQKSGSSKKPPGFLPDGRITYLDLCLSPGENSATTACGQGSRLFGLFRCSKVGGPSSIGLLLLLRCGDKSTECIIIVFGQITTNTSPLLR